MKQDHLQSMFVKQNLSYLCLLLSVCVYSHSQTVSLYHNSSVSEMLQAGIETQLTLLVRYLTFNYCQSQH